MLALGREREIAELIPYRAQISEHVVTTAFLDYLQVFRLSGASFETADDERLNGWHERLNVLWRNIASPNVSLWTHILRRYDSHSVPLGTPRGFADKLSFDYQRRLGKEQLMVNELYLSVVFRPTAGAGTNLIAQILNRRQGTHLGVQEALDGCEKLQQTIKASLARYEPEPLGTYQIGVAPYSKLLEFLALLVNGEWQRVPMGRAPINEVLGTSRLLFGNETIEYRTPTTCRVGAMLGIKEYSSPTVVGMFNRLLSAPFPFVLSQSFTFISKTAAQGILKRQINRMANAGDFAVSQALELEHALDALTSNEFAMGDHHFSLQVLADLPQEPTREVSQRLRSLNDRVALARSLLADTGVTVAREDLALEAAFWSQLPGNLIWRVRRAPLSSRNFAAMSAFHNYPLGRPKGNHWGEAVATFMTSARSPYYFSLHASDPSNPDDAGRSDTGHTFICGPTGSGKTVFIGFLVALLARRGVTQIIFDKDRGLEILVRALDGEYRALRSGRATGFNPLQLPNSPADVEFLRGWLYSLARSGPHVALTVREQADLDQALNGTLALEYGARRLSRLIEFLDPTDPDGVHGRLARWCTVTRGDYAWVFDNDKDRLLDELSNHSVAAFDVTEFLPNAVVRTPLSLYLFHLVRRLLDGRRVVCWIDEFWRLIGDEAFEHFAKDGPKTWRKLNAAMCLATQSPSDVLDSRISKTIVEQTPTKVFFPNPEANQNDYVAGFGLSEREFKLVKEQLEPASRMFLVRQGHNSIVCQLDLRGFDGAVRVISGSASELQRVHSLLQAGASKADDWLPEFLRGFEGVHELNGGPDAHTK
jgi:type IV secretion system protein VirB4